MICSVCVLVFWASGLSDLHFRVWVFTFRVRDVEGPRISCLSGFGVRLLLLKSEDAKSSRSSRINFPELVSWGQRRKVLVCSMVQRNSANMDPNPAFRYSDPASQDPPTKVPSPQV